MSFTTFTARLNPDTRRAALELERHINALESRSHHAGHAQIYVASDGGAAVTLSDTTTWVEVASPTWTLSSAAHHFDMATNARMRYTGTPNAIAHIAISVSFTVGANLQVVEWSAGVNGVADTAAVARRKVGTGTDVGSTAFHLIAELSTNDYVSLFVRNTTTTAAVTLEVGNLQIMAVTPMAMA